MARFWGEYMTILRKIALSSVSAALIVGSVAPAYAAASFQRGAAPAATQSSADIFENASEYRDRYDRRRYRHHRHRRHNDAGAVIAGIGILAGIAIIASAASKSKKDRRRSDDYPYNRGPNDDRYNDRAPTNANYDGGNDLGSAVQICSRAAEQSAGGNARVAEIRSVTRDGDGWRVEGSLSGGGAPGFSCGAKNGQVDFIQLNS